MSRIQEVSSEFLDELRMCLGFQVWSPVMAFRVERFRFCLRDLETIVLITCCKRMENYLCIINE